MNRSIRQPVIVPRSPIARRLFYIERDLQRRTPLSSYGVLTSFTHRGFTQTVSPEFRSKTRTKDTTPRWG